MLAIPSQLALPRLQQDYEAMLAKLDGAQKVAKHKDEILAIWCASPFIKRVCIAQPLWLQGLIVDESLHEDF